MKARFFGFQKREKTMSTNFLTYTLCLLLSSVALSGKGKEPVLTNAVADLDAIPPTLSIFGDNFGPSPTVFLGTVLGTLEELVIDTSTDTFIQAFLPPAAPPPGTHLLVVSTGPGNKNMFAMDVTIGAVGPPGTPNPNIITEDLPLTTTGVGVNALVNNTGMNNTAMGWSALESSNAGGANTGVGARALLNNTGNGNTAVGSGALQSNSTGNRNTAVGEDVLGNNSTGSNNIAIGTDTGRDLTTGDNNIYIGNRGVAAESNTIRIGDGSTHTSAFIAGVQVVPQPPGPIDLSKIVRASISDGSEFAACPSIGQRVVGGGVVCIDTRSIQESFPTTSIAGVEGWQGVCSSFSSPVQVHAICIAP